MLQALYVSLSFPISSLGRPYFCSEFLTWDFFKTLCQKINTEMIRYNETTVVPRLSAGFGAIEIPSDNRGLTVITLIGAIEMVADNRNIYRIEEE